MAADGDLHRAVREFIEGELWLLDDGRLMEWFELFDHECSYWIPVDPAQPDPHQAPSLVYEERLALEARVRRLLDPRIVPQLPPSRTCRLLGGVRCSAGGAGLVRVEAKILTLEARANGLADGQRVFAGKCTYLLVPSGNSFRIRQKRVDLVNSEAGLHGASILL